MTPSVWFQDWKVWCSRPINLMQWRHLLTSNIQITTEITELVDYSLTTTRTSYEDLGKEEAITNLYSVLIGNTSKSVGVPWIKLDTAHTIVICILRFNVEILKFPVLAPVPKLDISTKRRWWKKKVWLCWVSSQRVHGFLIISSEFLDLMQLSVGGIIDIDVSATIPHYQPFPFSGEFDWKNRMLDRRLFYVLKKGRSLPCTLVWHLIDLQLHHSFLPHNQQIKFHQLNFHCISNHTLAIK